MLLSSIPSKVRLVLENISRAGFTAVLVGGAVRDILLGKVPKDFDIATNAKPKQVMGIAHKAGWKVIDQLGLNFGVVVVVIEGKAIEIATFRSESYGEDAHRPECIWFTDSLAEDLSRRDFTINAMALNLEGQVFDIFGGQEDLAARLIRTVGDPAIRFAEDGIRMFRACRFIAEHGFCLEASVEQAISGQLKRVNGLAIERVREEIRRILLAKWSERGLAALVRSGLAEAQCRRKQAKKYKLLAIFPELKQLVGIELDLQYYSCDLWEHTLKTMILVPPDIVLRWAALLYGVARGRTASSKIKETGQLPYYGHDKAGAEIAHNIMSRFNLPQKLIKRVVWLVSRHKQFCFHQKSSEQEIRSWLCMEARLGEFRTNADLREALQQLAMLSIADAAAIGISCELNCVQEYSDKLAHMAKKMPVHTCDLDYRIEDLTEILGNRQLLRIFLQNILKRIQAGDLEGSSIEIKNAAKEWIDEQTYNI